MNIQIFGKKKCFETKKAERYFKERKIKFQLIDLPRFGMSVREFDSVRRCVGLENLLDTSTPGAEIVSYLAHEADKIEKLLDQPELIKTPIVRNGKASTVGYQPDVWKTWE